MEFLILITICVTSSWKVTMQKYSAMASSAAMSLFFPSQLSRLFMALKVSFFLFPLSVWRGSKGVRSKKNTKFAFRFISMPKISIITPSYNQAHFLKETVLSVLSQATDFEIEHIIVDGGSTDGSVEYLRSLGRKVTWISEKDRGQADAVNKGVRMAGGEIIGWLNSDDVYLPGALQAVADYFHSHPECRWAYGRCRIIDSSGKEQWKWITRYKNIRLRKFTYDKLLRENFISQPAVFFRKDLFEEAGMLNIDLHYAMDYDLWLRFAQISPAGVINSYLSNFRRHGASKSEQGFRDQFFEQYAVAQKYHPSFFNRAAHRFNIFKIITSYRFIALFSRFNSL
jgi:glycosyltransferase involved in cell wall biosynthesis